MEEVIIKKYKSNDGRIFDDKELCEKYENDLKELFYYMVEYAPDPYYGGFSAVEYVIIKNNKYKKDIMLSYALSLTKTVLLNINNTLQKAYKITEISEEVFNEKTDNKTPNKYVFISNEDVIGLTKPIKFDKVINLNFVLI